MATNASQSDEDCLCPVCCDIFTDPVMLLCGHSFCKHCLQEWWRQSTLQSCPVCKDIFPMAQPPRNLALKNLSDNLRQARTQAATSRSKEHCSLHNEKFKLFCQEDQQLVCVICRDSQKHKKHNCIPINEAAAENRDILKVQLMHLTTKLGAFKTVKLNYDKMANHIKLQAQRTENTIKEEFQTLYQFLRAEEATRIDAVRKEAALKSETMDVRIVNLSAEISSLTDKITTIKGAMVTDDFSFMKALKSTTEQSHCNLPEPVTPSGALIDEAKHLGNMLFTVWKKMKKMIQFSPVTLDPNTSGHVLTLSKQLTCSTERNWDQQLPVNPERQGDSVVLGYESFNSGKYTWDVEIKGCFVVGVTTQIKQQTTPTIWGICLHGNPGPVLEFPTETRIDYKAENILRKKIRVQLNYDRGLLSFFDLDRNTSIHRIEHKFTEAVFPYFHGSLKILPAEVSLCIRQLR
ncbi:zinc-binding protein A33-like [Mastacembelus armatus]|uniref:Zinc-binding protein A33-like n=1 Tax=Mastacembelus armatus TaxID=205130 RepID=A0A7N8WHU3_9TELE|nr:zinc-binding protein A33-like [Mastacembelus armatus]